MLSSYQQVNVSASLIANGLDSGQYQNPQAYRVGGGGSGGSIILDAPEVIITAEISANGGNADKSNRPGGGGSGGRIAILGSIKHITGLLHVIPGKGYVAYPPRYGTVYYGDYLDAAYVPSMVCSTCPADSYYDVNHCASCPFGSVSPVGSTALSDCVCAQGYTRVGGVCNSCPVGTFKNTSGDESCTACKPASTTNKAGATHQYECFCNPGTYGSSSIGCKQCGVGEYNPYSNQTSCVNCPVPRITTSNGTSSLSGCVCDPGYYQESNGDCMPCSPGTYKDIAGNEACTACPTGRDSAIFGGVSLSSCYCLPGYTGLDCNPCGPGYYKEVVGSGSCQACPPGYFQPVQAATSPARCLPCSLGYYSDVNASRSPCTACPINTYADTLASVQCTPCQGNSSSSEGAISQSRCLCNPGYDAYSPGVCEPCSVGYYKGSLGNVACQICPDGYYSDHGATTACTVCPANSWAPTGSATVSACLCIPGYTLVGGSCEPCPAGTYKPTISNANCTSCPAITYLPYTGSTNESQCFACPPHSTSGVGTPVISGCACDSGYQRVQDSCLECGAGQYSIGQGQCAECPANTYTVMPTATSVLYCSFCPNNTFSPPGSSIISACTCLAGYIAAQDGLACTPCPAGTYKTTTGGTFYNASGACQECPIDTYTEVQAQTWACTPCPAYSYTLQSRTSNASHCICESGHYRVSKTLCNPCTPGSYKHDSSAPGKPCDLCPIDTYLPVYGSIGPCFPCINHTTTLGLTGRVYARDCVCNPGYYGSGNSSCSLCPKNHYCLGGLNALQCPFGSYSKVGAPNISSCVCLAGFHGAGGNCLICPPNHYCAGGASILPCSNNSYSPESSTSSSNCTCRNGYLQNFIVCPAGYYGVGHGDCTLCHAGTYNNRTGQLACEACPILVPVSPVGSVSIYQCGCLKHGDICVCPPGTGGYNYPNCTVCPTGTYSTGNGTIYCTSCPAIRPYSPPGTKDVTGCGCRSGYYGTSSFDTPCQPCPSDKAYSPPGSQFLSDCSCPSGYVSASDSCVVCQQAVVPVACPADRPLSSPYAVSAASCFPCADGYNATAAALALSGPNASVVTTTLAPQNATNATDTCSCPTLYVAISDGCVVCSNAINPVPCPGPTPYSPDASTSATQCSAFAV
ncbi:hypothetical protein GUITHDRAFT_119038 [Guillardia theta CCMP2712]|uniref:Laminin EGF-like domain-containing protein n=1 Tax=Guillardia theta (strain CCMP2712) TaxID=905079 RepID=L1IFL5_GUITC|nr:hypothetical protein GUITHDRAFT_119038 [Guillardia theta CCMP2712]EKX34852.1 hypothetical protein GUITHDRAFT_119038 [Guillardia theta CCMP2712]|eukprot:XP_005821832.1 hypothetical protein GUITHDRAFT_119038 [Guillardia theta CCMP2712]